jgi:hypothetical protein
MRSAQTTPLGLAIGLGGGAGSPLAMAAGPAARALVRAPIAQVAARAAQMEPVTQRIVPTDRDFIGSVSRETAPFPELGERYPQIGGFKTVEAKKGGGATADIKVRSDEEQGLLDARRQINKDLDQPGSYTPYFDPAKRYDVDPQQFPPQGITAQEAVPAKQATIDKYTAMANDPAALERLNAAYDHGVSIGGGDRWYQVGQVAHEFVQEYGPERGLEEFKRRFALPMAATTTKASPEDNLIQAAYYNYLRQNGMPIPGKGQGWTFPSPTGTFSGVENMRQAQLSSQWGDFQAALNPKRHNFAYNYMGHPNFATLDEQMGRLWHPSGDAPFADGTAYGIYEQALAREAAKRGVDPRTFQEIAWAGQKNMRDPSYVPHPMIETVNRAIERTHRLTGMDRSDIVRRGLVRGEIPLYGAAGVVALGAAAPDQTQAGERPHVTITPNIQDRRGETPGLAEARDTMGVGDPAAEARQRAYEARSAAMPDRTRDPMARALGYNRMGPISPYRQRGGRSVIDSPGP